MSNLSGERHDGTGKDPAAARHIQAPAASDILSQVALLKLDSRDGSAKVIYTLWVDSTGDLRILAGEPSAAQLAAATTAAGSVVGGQS